jgi:hypothetical protein
MIKDDGLSHSWISYRLCEGNELLVRQPERVPELCGIDRSAKDRGQILRGLFDFGFTRDCGRASRGGDNDASRS